MSVEQADLACTLERSLSTGLLLMRCAAQPRKAAVQSAPELPDSSIKVTAQVEITSMYVGRSPVVISRSLPLTSRSSCWATR